MKIRGKKNEKLKRYKIVSIVWRRSTQTQFLRHWQTVERHERKHSISAPFICFHFVRFRRYHKITCKLTHSHTRMHKRIFKCDLRRLALALRHKHQNLLLLFSDLLLFFLLSLPSILLGVWLFLLLCLVVVNIYLNPNLVKFVFVSNRICLFSIIFLFKIFADVYKSKASKWAQHYAFHCFGLFSAFFGPFLPFCRRQNLDFGFESLEKRKNRQLIDGYLLFSDCSSPERKRDRPKSNPAIIGLCKLDTFVWPKKVKVNIVFELGYWRGHFCDRQSPMPIRFRFFVAIYRNEYNYFHWKSKTWYEEFHLSVVKRKTAIKTY